VTAAIEFQPWPKTPRLFRNVTITEKIDGTNAAIGIRTGRELEEIPENAFPFCALDPVGEMVTYWIYAQSRNRIITPQADNAGFASWVYKHADSLVDDLGPGLHYGEWWGEGIQRGYGQDHKRLSLFNAAKWSDSVFRTDNLDTVPVLAEHVMDTSVVIDCVKWLADAGSIAAPGFTPAEGVVVYHHASKQVFKALIQNDHLPKSAVA
jgi:RNA ligase-like protein